MDLAQGQMYFSSDKFQPISNPSRHCTHNINTHALSWGDYNGLPLAKIRTKLDNSENVQPSNQYL